MLEIWRGKKNHRKVVKVVLFLFFNQTISLNIQPLYLLLISVSQYFNLVSPISHSFFPASLLISMVILIVKDLWRLVLILCILMPNIWIWRSLKTRGKEIDSQIRTWSIEATQPQISASALGDGQDK